MQNNRSFKQYLFIQFSSDVHILEGQNRLIHDEFCYDRSKLIEERNNLFSNLTNEQKSIYEKIMNAVLSNKCGVFFIYGYRGIKKIFIYRTLVAALRSK